MLTEKRIREAHNNVKSYFDEGLLKKICSKNEDVDMLIENSKESLEVANFIFDADVSVLWVVVSSYYSMYYIANAVLHNFGYKVGDKISHKITNDALIVFVREKLKSSCLEDFESVKTEAHQMMNVSDSMNLADDIIQSFEFEKNKRSNFQYKIDSNLVKSKSRAKTSLDRAKNFIHEMEKLI